MNTIVIYSTSKLKIGVFMSLMDEISNQIKDAMRAKDKVRLNVLRYIKKLFIENNTSKKPVAEQDIIISYAKKVKDSLSMYPEGTPQREGIVAEVAVLSEFLPKQLTEEEVIAIINEIKSSLDAPNMGAIMKELSPRIKGQFDGKIASSLVQQSLK